jgi:hypothetical protein
MQSPFFLETFSLPDEIQELKLPCAQQRQQQNAGLLPLRQAQGQDDRTIVPEE